MGRHPLKHHSGDGFGLEGRQIVGVNFLRSAEDPSRITSLEAEAYAWGTRVRFDRLN